MALNHQKEAISKIEKLEDKELVASILPSLRDSCEILETFDVMPFETRLQMLELFFSPQVESPR